MPQCNGRRVLTLQGVTPFSLRGPQSAEVVDPPWGAGRLQNRNPAHPQGQERHAGHAPLKRARDARAPPHQRESTQRRSCLFSERGAPLSAPGFCHMIERAATAADLGIKAHAHMLRHACGYKLANDGHDTRAIQAYLGHRNIQNTSAIPPWRRSGLRNSFATKSSVLFGGLTTRTTPKFMPSQNPTAMAAAITIASPLSRSLLSDQVTTALTFPTSP